MGRVLGEALRLLRRDGADVLEGHEAFEGLQALGEVVVVDEGR
jgi:hypothetical protein